MPSSNGRLVSWRAKRTADGKFIYGQLLQFGTSGFIFESSTSSFPVDISTKGESIGLVDKNGKSIYEGDLVLVDVDGESDVYIIVHRGCGFVGKHYQLEIYINLLEHELEVVGEYYSSQLEKDLEDIKNKLGIIDKREKEDDDKRV